MELLTTIVNDCPRGVHLVTVEMSAGTAVLEFKTDETNSTYMTIDEITSNIEGRYKITFPDSLMRATLTGDAKMFIDFNVSG